MVRREDVATALTAPRQKHGLDVDQVWRRLKKLEEMWELLSQIAVIAESAIFTEPILDDLETLTVRFNIWWRDAFGAPLWINSAIYASLGYQACTYKVHKLLHLADSVRNCGPLRYTWLFGFERGNLVAAKSIHRRDRTVCSFCKEPNFVLRANPRYSALRCPSLKPCIRAAPGPSS